MPYYADCFSPAIFIISAMMIAPASRICFDYAWLSASHAASGLSPAITPFQLSPRYCHAFARRDTPLPARQRIDNAFAPNRCFSPFQFHADMPAAAIRLMLPAAFSYCLRFRHAAACRWHIAAAIIAEPPFSLFAAIIAADFIEPLLHC